MDATGPILLVLVVACLFYIVPRRLQWRISDDKIEQDSPLRLTTLVHSGTPVSPTGDPSLVSTGLTRRAGRRTALRLARYADRRRQVIFWVLLAVTLATVPGAIVGWLGIHWWASGLGGLATLGWLVYSHIEARRIQRQLDALLSDRELQQSEATVAVPLVERVAKPTKAMKPEDLVKSIVGPNGDQQFSLLDPIPRLPPSYLSRPTLGRTVRTIDLSPPSPFPVTGGDGEETSGRIAV